MPFKYQLLIWYEDRVSCNIKARFGGYQEYSTAEQARTRGKLELKEWYTAGYDQYVQDFAEIIIYKLDDQGEWKISEKITQDQYNPLTYKDCHCCKLPCSAVLFQAESPDRCECCGRWGAVSVRK